MSDALRLQLQSLLNASDVDQSVVSSVSDDFFLETPQTRIRESHSLQVEQLANLVRSSMENGTTEDLCDLMHEHETQREREIQQICESPENPLVSSLDQLALVNSEARKLRREIDLIGRKTEISSKQLIETVNLHIQKNRTRMNIEQSLAIVKLLLQALEHTNQVEAQLKSGHRAAAVQNLQDLQSMELDELKHIGMGMLIGEAVKSLSRDITRATVVGIDTFFSSQQFRMQIADIGQRSFELLRKQEESWREITKTHKHLKSFRLNSPVELAYRRSKKNYLTLSQLEVDLGPLYEADMVYKKLGIEGKLVTVIESRLSALSDRFVISQPAQLVAELPGLVGLCLFDRTLSVYLPSVRPAKMVDDNWEKLAQNISRVVTAMLRRSANLGELKYELGRLMGVLQIFDFNCATIVDVFRRLLVKSVDALVASAVAEFRESWQGDQMQMVVTNSEDYDAVLKDVWYQPEEPAHFPQAFPFSSVYHLMCRRLRSLLALGSSFLDYLQEDPGFVENTVASAVDTLLTNTVCKNLENVPKSNRELVVQSMINLQLFSQASADIQRQLSKMREATGRRGAVALDSTAELTRAVKAMETRIYVLLEETVKGFFAGADFDWLAESPSETPSTSVLEMTTYVLTLANTLLKRLPPEVRLLALFNLTEHIGSGMRDSLYGAPSGITAVALDNFDTDLKFLEDSISQITDQESPSEALVEIRQMLDLLRSADPAAEFNDAKIRNRKYGRISVPHATQLIRKVKQEGGLAPESISPKQSQSGFMRYLRTDPSTGG